MTEKKSTSRAKPNAEKPEITADTVNTEQTETLPAEKPIKRAVKRARNTVEKASELAMEVAVVAKETAKGVAEVAEEAARAALQQASEGAQVMAQLAEDGAKVAAQFAGDTARAAGRVAQEVALQMAQAYLRKSSLTLDISESLLNKQIRQMAAGHEGVDHVTVYCGNDRLRVAIDCHYQRIVYTVELAFDVLECKVSRDEQFLVLRQVDEGLDAQLRQGNLLTNWATRQVANRAFALAQRLPTRAPVNQILQDVPGMRREGPRRWRYDLGRTVLLDLLSNRSWMIEKLLGLSDLSELPGLTTLKDSQDMLLQLVNQFEIRDMRVRPGRLEVLVGINAF